jgi:putative transcriptional regulator
MNAKHTTKNKGKTDWDKVGSLTEEQIEKAAASDPDAPLLTNKELSEFKRVNPNAEFDVGFIRNRLSMTQEEFASNFGINKRTLEGWEQHRKRPSETETTFLKVIEKHGEEIKRMVKEVGRFKSSLADFRKNETTDDEEGTMGGDQHVR